MSFAPSAFFDIRWNSTVSSCLLKKAKAYGCLSAMLLSIHFWIPNCVSEMSQICGSYIPDVYHNVLTCLSEQKKNTKFPAATHRFFAISLFPAANGSVLSVLFVAYSDSRFLSKYCTLS